MEESKTTEIVAVDETSLVTNTDNLNTAANEIVGQLVKETDAQKIKDLTYLFNTNQIKIAAARTNKLNVLLDTITETTAARFAKHPDEISNRELLDAMRIVSELIDKNNGAINRQDEAPLIQINQQTNEVNMGEGSSLNRESRERVKNAVMELLKNVATANTTQDIVGDKHD